MIHRLPADLPNGYVLYVPFNYGFYLPITNTLFQDLFSSSEFPNETFAEIKEINTNSKF